MTEDICMDIKGVINSVLPLGLRGKEKVDRAIKSENTTERDANGQTPGEQQGQQRPPMSEDQLKRAIEHLKALKVVQENGLSVELIDSEGKKFILLKEPSGKVVRRIPEAEMWSLLIAKDSEKGQLLRKTA